MIAILFSRTGWTPSQNKLFDAVIAALHAEHLARLAYVDLPAEPILRRCSLDKTTRRVRSALTHVLWKTHATQWLHSVLLENLNQTYLSIYLDVLQVENKMNNFLLRFSDMKKIDLNKVTKFWDKSRKHFDRV